MFLEILTWIPILMMSFEMKPVIVILLINFSMCFGFSKEPSHREGSLEHQHIFWLKIRK